MPIYLLGEDPYFPNPEYASKEGIVAVGGDLSPLRLLNAYACGIFPWYNEGEPIMWWSPDPRLVLFPENLHVPSSLEKVIKKKSFRLTVDEDFIGVIENCRDARINKEGTWITPAIRDSYILLNELGFAHSIEAWVGDQLAGGLYGVSLGRCFFGESMFFTVPNASKVAFVWLAERLFASGFHFIDCQVYTPHLSRFGAIEITRKKFLKILRKGLKMDSIVGKWDFLNEG